MNIKSLKQIVLTVICLLGIGSTTAWSQSIHVKGTVLDENGAGFIGAGVVQKGTTNGTMTDANGNFEINVRKVPSSSSLSSAMFRRSFRPRRT